MQQLHIPPRPDQILCLYLASAHLPILRALFDVCHQLLLLIFQLDLQRSGINRTTLRNVKKFAPVLYPTRAESFRVLFGVFAGALAVSCAYQMPILQSKELVSPKPV